MVTLQINLAPSDLNHAIFILPHQIRFFYASVDEILLVYDTHKSKGRFGENFEENNSKLRVFIHDLMAKHPKVRIKYVDYSIDTRRAVSTFFLDNKALIPYKDYRGGPFYAYFYGLFECEFDIIIHLDSDILLGGEIGSWVEEAQFLLGAHRDILTCSPLPGPPRRDNVLIGQEYAVFSDYSNAYSFNRMSTRVFMLNRKKIYDNKLKLLYPNFRAIAKAIVEGNPPYELPEEIISKYMNKNNFKRVDFKGINGSCWTLHPPYRTKEFYIRLPEIIELIQNNKLPESQYGFYDLVDDVISWDEAKSYIRKNRWWKRLFKK